MLSGPSHLELIRILPESYHRKIGIDDLGWIGQDSKRRDKDHVMVLHP